MVWAIRQRKVTNMGSRSGRVRTNEQQFTWIAPCRCELDEREAKEVEVHCRKAYVSVNLDVDKEGTVLPRLIRWDNGQIFNIDQILYKCRASSKKVGGGGIRYTVMIRGKESFLFHEGDKWFVEAKESS